MWYFAWALGLSVACGFSILNGMWFYSVREDQHPSTKES